jgi:hypothetical protein
MKPLRATCTVFFIVILSVLLTETVSVESKPVAIVTPTPAPTPTATPQPPTTTPTTNIALDYNQVSIDEGNETTIVVLGVNVKYNFGANVTLNFQDFLLNIFRERGGVPLGNFSWHLHTYDAIPVEIGSVTVGNSNREAYFELTFSFSTMQDAFEGPVKYDSYQLVYNGNVYTESNPTPTATDESAQNPQATPTQQVSEAGAFGAGWLVVALVVAAIGITVLAVVVVVTWRGRKAAVNL